MNDKAWGNLESNKESVLARVEEDYLIPSKLYIECTNLCNARCVFCYYKNISDDLVKMFMPLEMFEEIVKQYIAMGGTEIALTPTIADPLTDPMFNQRIELLDRCNIRKVTFYTNLISFGTKVRDALANVKNLSIEIGVSFTGFDKEKYKELMGVDKFETVKKNLEKLSIVQNINRTHIEARVVMRSYVDQEPAATELKKFIRELGLKVGVDHEFDSWGGLLENELKENKQLRLKKRQPRIGPCMVSYTKPVIAVNGDMKLCDCRDVFGDLVVGNILETPLKEIWEGRRIREMRDKFFNPETLPEVCQKCEVYKSIFMIYNPASK
jgi:radical SAM protein with 4Fe4S-binding SPASM domain